jgi:hypothetical protein
LAAEYGAHPGRQSIGRMSHRKPAQRPRFCLR